MRANEFISEGIWDKMKSVVGNKKPQEPQTDPRNVNNIIVYPKADDAASYLARNGTHRAPSDQQQYTYAYRNMSPVELEHAKKLGFLGVPPEEVWANARGNPLDKWWSAGDDQGIVGISRKGGPDTIQVRIPLSQLSKNRAAEIKHMQVLSNNSWQPVTQITKEDELDEMALPSDWDPAELGHDKTFKNRLDYALQRAPKLGGGSSRVVFTVEDNGRPTALKVAKNKKGMAQNAAEVDILSDEYISKLDIVIPLVDYDKANPQPTWLQTEVAQKASEQTLCKIMRSGRYLFHLTTYANSLIGNADGWAMGRARDHLKTLSPEDQEIFKEYATKLAELVSATDLQMGDFDRAANWGLYNGNPVVIDLGYTSDVAKLYWG